jgi:NAD(P)-dependent dehydrogenase (short-subunit alcohol dehydrogenase family)
MSNTGGLRDSSVIVTGAGSGIGRAAALRFARLGAKVLIADINPAAAESLAQQIETEGGTARIVIGDLSEQHTVEKVVTTTVKSFGHLDVLVNNAGIGDSGAATADVNDTEWERTIRINLTAPFLLTRAALPHLLARGKGAIVNMASEAGLRGSATGTAYTVSKHGVVGLTRSAAVLYRDRGIRVNAIAPGPVQTNIGANLTVDDNGAAAIKRYKNNVGRRATADEVAAAIVFLASDEASNISGVILPVDDGWSAV